MVDDTDKEPGRGSRSLMTAAVKSGLKAVTTARGVLRSEGVTRLRGGVKNVVGSLAGVTRFVRTNTLRGLLGGEIILKEHDLNRWLSRVEPPESVSKMRIRCLPSRLVLSFEFERRLLGVRIARTKVDLPFEIENVDLSAEGGEVVLRLDEDARTPARGFLQPIFLRLMSRAAADLMDDDPLDELDDFSDLIERDGDLFILHLGDYPPFAALLNKELRLPAGKRLLPFRALHFHDATVEEGQMVVHVAVDREGLRLESDPALLDEEELNQLVTDEDEPETVEVTILEIHLDD